MAGILDGKVALITGAGSGIGQATSRIFAREGAKLVLADVVEAGGNQTLKMVQELRADAIFVKCDVSKWSDVEAAVAKAVATYGRLDCAFNNAGIEGEGGNTHECTEENWARVISINLTGVWLCMKAESRKCSSRAAAVRSSTPRRARAWQASEGCPPTSPQSTVWLG
jgi:NAD(P)-dependent dehydrogenase (short-subunit alcohol dehydrogenase family)